MQRTTVRAAILAAGAAVTLSSAQAAVFTATWTGGAGNSNYSDPANWNIPGNPGAVPVNDATDQYNIVIPNSASVELDIATPNAIDVLDFTLGTGATLTVRPGRAFTVLDDAQIGGTIAANGISSFTATTPGTSITGASARFLASGDATITVAAATYNAQNLGSTTVYSADGASTTLDMSGISAYNWLGDFGGAQTQRITATNGALIDLGSLQTIAVNAESQDRLVISQTGGANIDLSSLTTISGTSEVRFETDAAAFSVPNLTSASNLTFGLIAGSSLTLPSLVTQTGGAYDIPANADVTLASATTVRNTAVSLAAGASFSAPQLTDFSGSSLTLGAGHTVTVGQLNAIDDARFILSAGATFASVTDDGYTTDMQYGGSQTQFSADGAGTNLDLSSLTSYTVTASFGGAQVQHITATNGGNIDLSGLASIANNVETQDRIEITSNTGGTVDLSSLQSISGAGEVRIVSDAAALSIPALAGANNVTYALQPGATLNLPALVTQTSGRFDVPAGATFNLPMLASLTNSAVTIGTGTFSTPVLANIDNTQLLISAGGAFTSIDDTYNSNMQYGGSRVQLSADGASTLLDLSAMSSYIANGNFGGVQVQQITAANGGLIDLSGLTSITLDVETQDRLEIISTSGGMVDLSSLQTITGAGEARFIADTATFTIPALTNANNANYVLQPGATLNLPALVSQTSGRLDVPAGGTFNLPALASLTNAVVTVGTGAISAPVLANIDNTQLAVTSGGSFTTSDDIYNTNMQYGGTRVQLSADGVGSSLDLASLTAYNVNGNFGGAQVHQIRATNSAHIDLSGLTSIAVNAEAQDRLEFFAQSGASVDLTSLQSITGVSPTRFTASGGGIINLGDLTVGQNVQFVVSDVTSTIDFAGSLIMNGGTASFAAASTLAIGSHLSHSLTDETAFAASTAILQMAAPSARAATEQFLEVAGLDVGNMNPGNNGNFGYGQLVVGIDGGAATQVTLLDVVDNGNRGGPGGEPEALYLFGLGGPEGLIINAGSTLLINNINVYFFDDGEWVHLNSLFGPDEFVIPFDDGFVAIPAPGALPMLTLALLAGARRRR